MICDIPIDFCPKCRNKKIRVVQGKTFEVEYSLTGKCLRSSAKRPETYYTLLKCGKCGWQSSPWGESCCDMEEWEELQEIYYKNMEDKK